MIARTELSQYRQRLRNLISEIGRLSFYSVGSVLLIQGTPGEVFRTFGKKNCKCAHNPSERNGPYFVIQIYKEKKKRQISLKKGKKK